MQFQCFIGNLGDVKARLSFHVSTLKTSKQNGQIVSHLNSEIYSNNLNIDQSQISQKLNQSLANLESFKTLLEEQIQSLSSSASQENINQMKGMLNYLKAGIQETKRLREEINNQFDQVNQLLSSNETAPPEDAAASDNGESWWSSLLRYLPM